MIQIEKIDNLLLDTGKLHDKQKHEKLKKKLKKIENRIEKCLSLIKGTIKC